MRTSHVVMSIALLACCSKQDENEWLVRDAKKDVAGLKQALADYKS